MSVGTMTDRSITMGNKGEVIKQGKVVSGKGLNWSYLTGTPT